MINFADKATNPSFKTAKQVLFSLQDRQSYCLPFWNWNEASSSQMYLDYPERLAKARVINLPFVVKGFFSVIKSFIDPVTREKLSFDKNHSGDVDPAQLDVQFGGQLKVKDTQYDHQEYWTGPKGVVTLARERQKRMMAKFRELGGSLGLSEWDFKEDEEHWTWPQPPDHKPAVENHNDDSASL